MPDAPRWPGRWSAPIARTAARSPSTAARSPSRNPADAAKVGIGYLSEDRKRYGVLLGRSVRDNVVLASMPAFTNRFGFVQDKQIAAAPARDYIVASLRIRTPSIGQLVQNLSGGNQQKAVVAKWLVRDCDILIFDEPTRGIDVGAKDEIYALLDDLAADGKAIIMISSELPEILRMSHRIAVMCAGPAHRDPRQRRRDPGKDHALRHALQCRRNGDHSDHRPRPRPRPRPGSPLQLSGSLQQLLAFASLIVILVFFSFASPYFFTTSNLVGILMAATVTGILALGTTFVIISGGIDLSIGTGMILCGVMTGVFLTYWGWPVWAGVAGRRPVRRPDRLRQRVQHVGAGHPAVHRDPGHDARSRRACRW